MISNPVIRQELLRLQNCPLPRVFFGVTAELLVDNRVVPVLNVMSEDITGDFIGNFTDLHFVRFQVGVVTYKKLILPKADKLVMRLFYKTQDARENTKPAFKTFVEEYTCTLTDLPDLEMGNDTELDESEHVQETSRIIDLIGQLTPQNSAEMRFKDVGGIYPNTTLERLMMVLMAPVLENRTTHAGLSSKNYKNIRGVNLVKPSNSRTYKHIIVPQGTKMTKLPTLLHKNYGIYAAGLGYYYRSGFWYVFPLYDYTRFRPGTRRLTIYSFPFKEFPSAEKTFMYQAEQLSVFTGSTPVFLDEKQRLSENVGTGINFTRAKDTMGHMVKHDNNKALSNVGKTNRKALLKERADGVHNISHLGITDNPYWEMSRLAQQQGRLVKYTWDNADPTLVYPGMPTKVIFERAGKLVSALGTLVGVRVKRAPGTDMMADNGYRTIMSLIVFVENKEIEV